MNQVILVGRLARDMVSNTSGKVFYSTVAVETGWNAEEKKAIVQFIPFRTFNLSVAQHKCFLKGTSVAIQGQIENSSREVDGDTLWETSVVVFKNNLRLIGAKPAPKPQEAETASA